MGTKFNHALTASMVNLLRWYQHSPMERKRRWKERPHPNLAQRRALVARGLVLKVPPPYESFDDLCEVGRITPAGRALLKFIDKAPDSRMPK